MARLASFNGISDTLFSPFPKALGSQTIPRKGKLVVCSGKKVDEIQEFPLRTTRRAALGLASVAISANSGIGLSLAEDNGFWLTSPLPVPSVYNKIVNEETGTRSFLKKGIYMANIGPEGSAYRIKKYAFDLMGLGDLIGQDAWNYVRKYLRIKSTFMFYDFDKVISAAPVNDQKPLTDLANRLFDTFEKLEDAVKKHDLPQTEAFYQDTTVILKEVMDQMA